MNKLLSILLMLFALSACQPMRKVLPTPPFTSEPIEQETTFTSTPSSIPAIEIPTHTPSPGLTSNHTPEPTKTLDMLGYQVKVGDVISGIRPVSVNDEVVYLSDNSFDILFMMSNKMLFELITPLNEQYSLEDVEDLVGITKELYPEALTGQLVDKEEANQASCVIPDSITTGDEILCGFSFDFYNSEVSILILGTTLRKGVNSPIGRRTGEGIFPRNPIIPHIPDLRMSPILNDF